MLGDQRGADGVEMKDARRRRALYLLVAALGPRPALQRQHAAGDDHAIERHAAGGLRRGGNRPLVIEIKAHPDRSLGQSGRPGACRREHRPSAARHQFGDQRRAYSPARAENDRPVNLLSYFRHVV